MKTAPAASHSEGCCFHIVRYRQNGLFFAPACDIVCAEGGRNYMKEEKDKYQRAFIPSNPQDKHRSQIEIMNWKAELEAEKRRERRETRRFIITTVISSIAAISAMTGVLIQLLSK